MNEESNNASKQSTVPLFKINVYRSHYYAIIFICVAKSETKNAKKLILKRDTVLLS